MLIESAGLEEDKGIVYENLPVGKYKVEITSIGPSQNPNSTWDGIVVKVKVVEHEKYNNRQLTLPIAKPVASPQTDDEKRDRARLARLLIACGVSASGGKVDTQDLMNKRFVAAVSIQKDKQTGQERNQITDYLPIQ